MKASTWVLSWEALTGQGYFWFRDGFDDFTLAPLSQKCHLGSEAAAMKGTQKELGTRGGKKPEPQIITEKGRGEAFDRKSLPLGS